MKPTYAGNQDIEQELNSSFVCRRAALTVNIFSHVPESFRLLLSIAGLQIAVHK
jgi:hypothetical protein